MFVLPAKFLADDVKVGIFREIRFVSVRKVVRLLQKNFPAGLREKIFQKNSFQQHRLGLDCGDPASRRLDWSRIAANLAAISTGSHVCTHSVLSSGRVASNIAAGWR